jgi:hypothetical protein
MSKTYELDPPFLTTDDGAVVVDLRDVTWVALEQQPDRHAPGLMRGPPQERWTVTAKSSDNYLHTITLGDGEKAAAVFAEVQTAWKAARRTTMKQA